MKRAVAQRAGWSAACFAFERYERERIGLGRLGRPSGRKPLFLAWSKKSFYIFQGQNAVCEG